METVWLEWVENASQDWKNDGFLNEHTSITVTS